jgi:integrase
MTDTLIQSDTKILELVNIDTDYLRQAMELEFDGSEGTKRQYGTVINRWNEMFSSEMPHPHDLTYENIKMFLDSSSSLSRYKMRLTVMRRVMRVYTQSIASPNLAKAFALVDKIKPSKHAPDFIPRKVRKGQALDITDIDRLLDAFKGNSNKHIRNRSIIALLFDTGLRRAELASLLWSDIDFTVMTIEVEYGKGNKERVIPMTDLSASTLREWAMIHNRANSPLFVAITRGDNLTNKAMDGQAVYYVVKQAEHKTGIKFAPHDARRTLATNSALNGTPITVIRDMLGHADTRTTSQYAKKADAQMIAKQMKRSY